MRSDKGLLLVFKTRMLRLHGMCLTLQGARDSPAREDLNKTKQKKAHLRIV